MKVATWNVNSIRVRLPQVLDWIGAHRPDVLCVQETKIADPEFPADAFHSVGYGAAYAGQRTYNGVATLSRRPAKALRSELPGVDNTQKRFLAASIDGLRVINVYVPNGEEVGSEKYAFKLSWLQALKRYLAKELKAHRNLLVVGDFNIAPEERDVHDPQLWEGRVLFSAKEREALRRVMKIGLVDLFRRFDQPPNSFTWWDYRQAAFRRNMGLRIDHILSSRKLSDRCRACYIDTDPRGLQRPSDHAPVVAEFDP